MLQQRRGCFCCLFRQCAPLPAISHQSLTAAASQRRIVMEHPKPISQHDTHALSSPFQGVQSSGVALPQVWGQPTVSAVDTPGGSPAHQHHCPTLAAPGCFCLGMCRRNHSLESGFCPSFQFPRLTVLWRVSVLYSFLRLSNILPHDCTVFCLSFHQLVDICVGSTF